jgi:hypothetical protein
MSAAQLSKNSTIVRVATTTAFPSETPQMPRRDPPRRVGRRYEDDVPRTLLLAIGLWTGGVAAGIGTGMFARLPDEVLLALSALATFVAVSAVVLDGDVGAWFEEHRTLGAQLALSALGASLVSVGTAFAMGDASALTSRGGIAALLLLAPITLALLAAAARAARR